MKIALVEDNDNLRNTATLVLRETYAYDVDSFDAIPPASPRRYDIVILDLKLRETDGEDTLRQCRAVFGPTPVVVWTGESSLQRHADVISEGADWVIEKGQPMKALVGAIVKVHAQATRLFSIEGLRAAQKHLERAIIMDLVAVGG